MRLKEILARCPELNATAGHVIGFAAMMRDLSGDQIEDWMRRVEADDLPALHSFVTGIKRDQDAVVAGLTLPWSRGADEVDEETNEVTDGQVDLEAEPRLQQRSTAVGPAYLARAARRWQGPTEPGTYGHGAGGS